VRATIALPAVLPGPVVNLQLEATEGGVIVSWSAPETGGAPDGYIVHLRPEDGESGSGRTKTPRAKKTSVTFENLESGRTYQVWVRAQNEAGKGERTHVTITLPEAEPAQQDGQSGQ
ncbi:MAG: fibronectin type III domain-containing protein, partial [Chloroflexi bacterium]|nr:fibronectin type III domain-containing protein [Chloroflexota bacterium]